MARFLGAFTAFLFGCGIMALLVGLLWGWLSWQSGVMGMAGLWVTALTAAAFLERGRD
jgi:membrane associated rhomboid family serine protease